jgi:hypothetical protein
MSQGPKKSGDSTTRTASDLFFGGPRSAHPDPSRRPRRLLAPLPAIGGGRFLPFDPTAADYSAEESDEGLFDSEDGFRGSDAVADGVGRSGCRPRALSSFLSLDEPQSPPPPRQQQKGQRWRRRPQQLASAAAAASSRWRRSPTTTTAKGSSATSSSSSSRRRAPLQESLRRERRPARSWRRRGQEEDGLARPEEEAAAAAAVAVVSTFLGGAATTTTTPYHRNYQPPPSPLPLQRLASPPPSPMAPPMAPPLHLAHPRFRTEVRENNWAIDGRLIVLGQDRDPSEPN